MTTTPPWPPIPPGDPADTRAKGEPWQPGCMVTQSRAVAVAATLFPDDVADGSDCRAMVGFEGLPCLACAEKNAAWADKVRSVRLAMLAAF